MNKEELIEFIVAELTIIAEANGTDNRTIGNQTMLFGSEGIIDSLGLISLVVKVEEFVYETTGKEIQVIDENALITESVTPFRNAITLAELILVKLNEE